MTVQEIVRVVKSHHATHTVITGGEPMIMPEVVQLCDALKSIGQHITMETAATVYAPVKIDLASLSPKLANSTPLQREGGKFAVAHEKNRLNYEVIQRFIDESPDYQLKFVVASDRDVEEVQSMLKKIKSWKGDDVLLMPEGTDAQTLARRAGWLGEICKRTGFRYCPRLHIEMYGNRRGT
jgi:7-carboxy-7-deazaguanine synthase